MIGDIAIALMAVLGGSVGMLFLLLLLFGDGNDAPMTRHAEDPFLDAEGLAAADRTHGPFIPMPDHLKTKDEMVAWMTRELPRLTANLPGPG